MELVAPSGHELATRADIRGVLDAMEAMDRRWEGRSAAFEEGQEGRFAAFEERQEGRFGALEQRWQARFATSAAELQAMEHRLQAGFERGIREAITSQTRTLVISQLAAIVAIAGLAFGLGG